MTLDEINQKTVVGILVQELIPALDTVLPWEPGVWNTPDSQSTLTHSSTNVVVTLCMAIDLPASAPDAVNNIGRMGSRGIRAEDGFLWISEDPNASSLLETWALDIGRLCNSEAVFQIEEGFT